jgi:hypothetical protein
VDLRNFLGRGWRRFLQAGILKIRRQQIFTVFGQNIMIANLCHKNIIRAILPRFRLDDHGLTGILIFL